MRHPGDVSAIAALFDEGALAPAEVVAILGKTEGNGCVNDFTRAYAKGQTIRCPVAHHDGNYFADAETLAHIDAISNARRPLLAYGALVLENVVRAGRPAEVVIS
eukprot:gene47413-58076_t